MTKLKAALAHAREGLNVFPLADNAKDPRAGFDNWPYLATTDETRIRQWWTRWPNANIAIYAGGLFLADIDPRKGGHLTFQQLALTEDFPKTRRCRTRGGGDHLYYRLPHGVLLSGGNDKLGQGIDVKTYGGYVVAPGSTIDGKQYKWGNENAIAEAPQWMLDTCKTRRPKSPIAGKRVAEEDEWACKTAWNFAQEYDEVQEGGRNNACVALANRFFDFALELPTAIEYVVAWSERACRPPMDLGEIQTTVESALYSRQNATGCSHPSFNPGMEVVEIAPRENPPDILDPTPALMQPDTGSVLEAFDDAAGKALSEAGDPLIEGILERGTLIVTFGESGGGKSFFKLDQYYAVAAGREWQGRKVKQGAILYVAAEGGKGIYRRVAALKAKYPVDKNVPFFVVRASLDLLRSQKDAEKVCAWAQEAADRSGFKVEAIVFDTLSRILAGGDENSPTDVGMLVKRIDYIREKTDAAVDLVHHTGKDKTKGARGHSLLRAAADTEIEVNGHRINVTKQRDMDGNVSMSFKLAVVRIGLDAAGRVVDSCTFEAAKATDHPVDMTPLQKENYDKIVEAAGDNENFTFGWRVLATKAELCATSDEVARKRLSKRLATLAELLKISYVSEDAYVLRR